VDHFEWSANFVIAWILHHRYINSILCIPTLLNVVFLSIRLQLNYSSSCFFYPCSLLQMSWALSSPGGFSWWSSSLFCLWPPSVTAIVGRAAVANAAPGTTVGGEAPLRILGTPMHLCRAMQRKVLSTKDRSGITHAIVSSSHSLKLSHHARRFHCRSHIHQCSLPLYLQFNVTLFAHMIDNLWAIRS
jgi:hypothetical protein